MNTLFDDMLASLQSGDERNFARLESTLYKHAWVYAKSIVVDPIAASEIVNEVFLRLWVNREQLNIRSSFRSYFYRVIHNHCCDYFRMNRKSSNHEVISIDMMQFRLEVFEIADPETYFDTVFSEESEMAFRREVEKLPQQCREIFILCRFKQMTYSEIAEYLDVSLSTVKTQMTRAMTRLKEALKDYL